MNGYTELTILGRKRGLKFGALAFERIGGSIAAIEQMGEYYTLKFTADLLYAGLINNCFRKDELPDFKYEDVFDWVEENANNQDVVNEIAEVVKVFEQSKPMQDAVESINQAKKELDEAKKKAGKRSKSSASAS